MLTGVRVASLKSETSISVYKRSVQVQGHARKKKKKYLFSLAIYMDILNTPHSLT